LGNYLDSRAQDRRRRRRNGLHELGNEQRIIVRPTGFYSRRYGTARDNCRVLVIIVLDNYDQDQAELRGQLISNEQMRIDSHEGKAASYIPSHTLREGGEIYF
jgi:hypothetical protein